MYGKDGHLVIPGSHWTVIKLGYKCNVKYVEVDTNHYKGNYPESVRVEGTSDKNCENAAWVDVVPRIRVGPNARHLYALSNDNTIYSKSDYAVVNKEVLKGGSFTHVRLTMYPDGGVSRFRLFGTKG